MSMWMKYLKKLRSAGLQLIEKSAAGFGVSGARLTPVPVRTGRARKNRR